MKLALFAKIVCKPNRLLSSRWVHDTAHVIVRSIHKAQKLAALRRRAAAFT